MAKTKETFSKTGSVDIFFIVVNILMIRKLLSFIVNSNADSTSKCKIRQ